MYEFGGPAQSAAQQLREALPLLAEQWERLDAPIRTVLAPGISPDEVDRLTEPHGLRVPVEVKALWEWHNGIAVDAQGHDFSIGPGRYEFLSVEHALREYVGNRATHTREEAEVELVAMDFWHRSWLPIFVAGSERLYVDCDRTVPGRAGSTPVRLVSWEWEAYDVDVASSILQAVRTWTWLLAQDFYRIDFVHGRRMWQADWAAIPLFLRVGGLA